MSTKLMQEVMQAFDNGELIQSRHHYANGNPSNPPGPWNLDRDPSWNWQRLEFRVRPKPLEGWINERPFSKRTGMYLYLFEQEAIDANLNSTPPIFLREVIDD